MLNPPNPLEQSNSTVALNLLHSKLPDPKDLLNSTQKLGLTGKPFYRDSTAVAAKPKRKMVFLILSFKGDGMDEVLATLTDECKSLGLKATSVKDVVGSDLVMKETAALIEKTELIICDLTYERPNVYYELGYAHGVGNTGTNILLIARDGTPLHFDIGTLGVKYYSSMESLRLILQENLPTMHRKTSSKQASKFAALLADPSPVKRG